MKTGKGGDKLGETPWDDIVAELEGELSLSIDEARDRVIWSYLKVGDTGPLICFLLRGYVPAFWVRHGIARMMLPDDVLSESPKLPIRLVAVARRRGPKTNIDKALRDRQLAKRVSDYITQHGKGSYDAAITDVAKDMNMGEQTVRNAYDKRHGKKTAN
jgi:hypothetical protein